MQVSLKTQLPNGHSLFAPSASSRWITCPGSLQIISKLSEESPDIFLGSSSVYAAEGTLMHRACDHQLDEAVESIQIGTKHIIDGHEIIFNEEHQKAVQQYTDIVHYFQNAHSNSKLYLEKHVSLEAFGYPFISGTADVIIDALPTLIIGDFKGGAGVQVFAENNTQLKLYAAMALSKYSSLYTKVITFIVQPRHRLAPLYEAVEYTVQEIEDFINTEITEAINSANSTNPKFCPSEKACKWCEGKEHLCCSAIENFVLTIAQNEFREFSDLRPKTQKDLVKASPIKLQQMLDASPLIKTFLSAVYSYALNYVKKGNKIPGYDLKTGKSNRKWTKEDTEMAKILETEFKLKSKDIFSEKLKGPLPIEKFFINGEDNKNKLDLYIDKPKGSLTLTKSSDPRPTQKSTEKASDDFEIIEGFKKLKPGTNAWSKYWKTHPVEQEAMLQWRILQ